MRVWLSYSLSDFLLFTSDTYYRLFELYNRALWPVHLAAAALGFMLLVLLFYGGERRGRAIAAILAAWWLWVAVAFLFVRYDTINWMARYAAAGFVLEAVLLIVSGIVLNRLRSGADSTNADFTSLVGAAIVVFALFIQPLFAPLLGRPWMQMEFVGLAPDPTVAATLGALLTLQRTSWYLFVIPLLWCVVTGATLWAMDAPDALTMPAIALLTVGLALWRGLRSAAANPGARS